MQVIAVMPAYKEAPRIHAAVTGCLPHVSHVLVVDDGSQDGTAEAAEAAGALVLRHTVNRGQGAALKTGTLAALSLGAEIIIHIDADGQHDPAGIEALIAPLIEGTHDVVFGSRFLSISPEGMPRSRRVLLHGIRYFNTYILGISARLSDPQSGLRAMNASAAQGIVFTQDGMAHCSEILRMATRSWRYKEVPALVRYTEYSLAKGQKATDALKIVWKLFLGSLQR
ncbi:glycosyltransferase family 2 protein [Patescibacteria group bacterium]|nr:glycosyltransferase family 2 protein [Patescibacteria group bacterium]